MAAPQLSPISLNQLLRLGLSPAALHNLGAGLLVGSQFWGSFIAGVIAFKALPRQQFGHLQSRTFPPFFDFQLALTSALLGSWLWRHPGLLRFHRAPLSEPSIPASFNAWLLMAMVATTALNRWALGPWTTKWMKRRHILERHEGKAHDDVSASQEMRDVSKKFGIAHSISSIVNLVNFGLGCVHLLYIGDLSAAL